MHSWHRYCPLPFPLPAKVQMWCLWLAAFSHQRLFGRKVEGFLYFHTALGFYVLDFVHYITKENFLIGFWLLSAKSKSNLSELVVDRIMAYSSVSYSAWLWVVWLIEHHPMYWEITGPPRLQDWPTVRGMQDVANQCFSLSFPFSISKKINKILYIF